MNQALEVLIVKYKSLIKEYLQGTYFDESDKELHKYRLEGFSDALKELGVTAEQNAQLIKEVRLELNLPVKA